jgi:phage-related protein
MDDKRIVWIGSSRDDLCRFPREAQRKAGYQLRLVQQGKEPDDFKPMPSVGPRPTRSAFNSVMPIEFFM